MRPGARTEGLRRLEQAEADRHGAQLLFDGGSYHLACFVAQQVAEKALKAFIYAQGEELVIGHSVEALSRWAAEFDADFEQLRGVVAPLDGYYIPIRYPNSLRAAFRPAFTQSDRLKMRRVWPIGSCRLCNSSCGVDSGSNNPIYTSRRSF